MQRLTRQVTCTEPAALWSPKRNRKFWPIARRFKANKMAIPKSHPAEVRLRSCLWKSSSITVAAAECLGPTCLQSTLFLPLVWDDLLHILNGSSHPATQTTEMLRFPSLSPTASPRNRGPCTALRIARNRPGATCSRRRRQRASEVGQGWKRVGLIPEKQ